MVYGFLLSDPPELRDEMLSVRRTPGESAKRDIQLKTFRKYCGGGWGQNSKIGCNQITLYLSASLFN
jgi:hypothetical protein